MDFQENQSDSPGLELHWDDLMAVSPMQQRRLGKSALVVSEICLGTMTFGTQCDEQQAHRLMDQAFEAGVTLYDTAEIYPVPPAKETFGLTEEIVGKWLKGKPREAVIIATKVTGPGHGWFQPPVREGLTALDAKQIRNAIEGSLRRLQTDYVDLYQTHWPDHGMRQEDTVAALHRLVTEGKVRVLGLCNETCWGVMNTLRICEKLGTTPVDTVQNNFSLINRRCQSELAQVLRREGLVLLPYSPIGGGVLTGKYNQEPLPELARFTEYLRAGGPRQKKMAARFVNERTKEVARRMGEIANQLGMAPATLAVAWSKQHDFVASTIIGANNAAQLSENLAATHVTLSPETLAQLDLIEEEIPLSMKEDGLRFL